MTNTDAKILGISPEKLFMMSVMLVNAGNYLYNLILGRYLGPEHFSDAAILITFLLVLSFVAMTFQLTVTKFITDYQGLRETSFLNSMKKLALGISILLAIVIAFSSEKLQSVFHTQSALMFVVFALGIPVYFLMSVNRGFFQGHKLFTKLSVTYQAEMISKLALTFLLLLLFQTNSSVLVSVGIVASLIFGLVPFKKTSFSLREKLSIESDERKIISRFIIITAFYELTQIIINNSDILLVKHYFAAEDAGLYASLALIGRVVYFVAWMFVMILLPTVVQKRKNGEDTLPVLLKYVGYVSLLATAIVLFTFFFPELTIRLMFGEAYLSIAPLLWKYALATSVFAISNVFVYYFLSLDKYVPVILSGIFGLTQITLIVFFHQSLEQVVEVQIIAMSFLLIIQLTFFFYQHLTKIRRQ